MSREEVARALPLVIVTMVVGCGGTTTGTTGVGDLVDASIGTGGRNAASGPDGGVGGSISSGGSGGATSGLVPCNDGTANSDCCPPNAAEGATCDGSIPKCSRGGCHGGFMSYLYCGGGTWSAGKGLFPCSVDAGVAGPAACVAAGGQCVIGGSTCLNVGSSDCNPDRNPGGAFCCLDQGFLVACNDGTRKTDCCPAGVTSGGTCSKAGLTCSTRCDGTGVRSEMICSAGVLKWALSESLWGCDAAVDASSDASVGIVCGSQACTANQFCVQQICRGGPNPCVPFPPAGNCGSGWTFDPTCGCRPPPCTNSPPYCIQIPSSCLPLPTVPMTVCSCANPVCSFGNCVQMTGRKVTCAAQ